MYQDEVPRISDWAHESPENFLKLATFVVCTIRVPFGRVASHFHDVQRKGLESAHLWGFKRDSYADLHTNPEEHFGNLFDADTIGFIDYIACNIRGLGIVKSAFIAQMFGHEVACMDIRNITDLGWNERAFRTDGVFSKLKIETRERRIADYLRFCSESGGAEHWWNHWCKGIAPGLGVTADTVSRWHWQIPTGEKRK